VDLGGKAAARAAERLPFLPPLPRLPRHGRERWCCRTFGPDASTTTVTRGDRSKVSNTPALLSRSKRFHTLFHLPNRSGSARQEILWTEK
jgi:hypothetical protein